MLQRHAGTLGSDVFLYSASHVSSCEFQYPDLTWKELCGLLSSLVAESGGKKGHHRTPFWRYRISATVKKHEACLSKIRALFLPNMLRVFTQQIVSPFILVIGVFRCHPHSQGLYQRDLFTQYYLFWKRWKLCNSRKTLFQKLIHRHYIKSREWQRFQHIKMSIFRNYKICTSCKSTINKFIIIRICSNKP